MRFDTEINGINISLVTGDYYFSPDEIDRGTLAMLSAVEASVEDKILDLGCGYGIVGIYLVKLTGGARIVMSDVSEDAVRLSEDNLRLNGVTSARVVLSDGLSGVEDDDFTLILSNPPYHTDFKVAKGFIENGFKKLKTGGKMLMVTKRLDWYKNKLISVFGGVRIKEIDGYYVFEAEKRTDKMPGKKKPANKLSKKLQRKMNRERGG